ncbi:MAG: S8 family serine peptidase [Calothrix sp. FI2-JRJ7]|jgi:thermitase|nr:S8 family serine peptidase [Calothrix sp. FI2-JRJ7]
MYGQPSNSNNTPIFEGFFLQMVMAGQQDKCQEIITQALGSDWEVKLIGDNGTEFEITKSDANTLSTKEAWDKAYNLRSQPGVVYAEPLFAVPVAMPIDPTQNFNQDIDLPTGRRLTGFENPNQQNINDESSDVDWPLKQLRVFETWQRFFPDPNKLPGDGILIGHPDTGYTPHPEIISNLLLNKAFDFLKQDKDPQDELETSSNEIINNPGHGTSTAGVIISTKAQQANYPTAKGITGVAPGAKLVPLRVSLSVVLISIVNISKAIEYAADNGIHVISISLGTAFPSQRLRSAIIYAQKRGVIIVAASGTAVPFVVWPAAYEEVIAVTGCDVKREVWVGSSRGRQVDVTAPGAGVWYAKTNKTATGLEYDINQGNGTSFSAPFIAGVAALWLSYHGRDQLIQRYGAEKIPFIFNQILRDSCEKFPTWKPNKFGEGLVNAEKVLDFPLPDNQNQSLMAPAFALQQHSPIDNGINTFNHLFEQQLVNNQPEEDSLETPDNTMLKLPLAQLLQTTPSELPKRLKEVGKELAFHFAADPQLYNQLTQTMQTPKPGVASFKTQQDPSNNLNNLRARLLNIGTSEVLKNKIN